MKFKTIGSLLLGLTLTATLNMSARPDGERNDREGNRRDQECRISDHHETDETTPVSIAGVIPIPGNPLVSADISWVDPATERYYFADRSNNGVDIIDAENDVWVGRVTGFAGPNTSGGGTATTNGPGPNGVLVTPSKHLWAGDGNSIAQVADADPTSLTYLQLLKAGGISTVWNNPAIPADTCDGGTSSTHFCGRADELAFDPKDHIIFIANNAPLSTATGHALIDPYGTFINGDTFAVLGHLSFVGAGGLEQSIWDTELQRFVVNVPGKLSTTTPATVITPATIQIINPITMKSELTFPVDCFTITSGVTTNASAAGIGITGIALAPYQHLLVSACGFPVIFTLSKGKVTSHVITQVGGGDEVWFNAGDGRFYVTGPLNGVTGNVQQLGVIDAEDSSFLQNVSEFGLRGRNPAAFPEANRIFDIQTITAPIVAGTTPDDSVCAKFNVVKTGCIAVFTHENENEEAEQGH